MAYKKFDDPTAAVDQSPRKVYDAFPVEVVRRALQGVLNRVVGGGAGGEGTALVANLCASCGTGGDNASAGLGVGNTLYVIVNGVYGTRGTAGNYTLPAGTQGANTFVKYLISGPINSTAGTVSMGNEGATEAKAKLPDCPDGHVALGYMLFATTAGTAWNRGTNCVVGGIGTASYVNLLHMPYDG